jgi:TniQ
MVLRRTVPLGAGETTASYASRLAAANGLSGREFCLDWNITFQSVVDGKEAAIATIADKGGVPAADLGANAFVRTEWATYLHRGERLLRTSLRRKSVAVCPACLKDDIAASNLRPQFAAFGRAAWQIDAVKTCAVHDSALVIVSDDMTPGTLHDFAHHVRPALADLDLLAGQAERRQPTGLETYVLDRLEGCRHSPLLDSLELFVAIQISEVLGAVDLFGRTTNLKKMTDEEWRLAGGRGFEIADGGEASVRDFLGKLQATFPYKRSGREGPQALFGRLYQVLEFGSEDPAWDPVRDVVGHYIRDHLPLGPEDVVFGKPVGRRTLHSVRTLSIAEDLHPKRIKKLLRAAGIIDDPQMALPDHNIIFDAQEGSAAVQKAKGALSLPAAGRHLNAPRVQIGLLAKHGFIQPFIPARAFDALDQFAVDDLDDFLKRLFAGAHAVSKPDAYQADIPSAAGRCCCSSVEVLRLILDKKLDWVGRHSGLQGYMSALVDVREIRGKVRGADKRGLTVEELKEKLSTTSRVAAALIKHGYMKTITAINPVNRCPVTVVPEAEVERFSREYVSLFAFAKERGAHFRVVKNELEAEGIEPALDRKKIGASFYRRSECYPDEALTSATYSQEIEPSRRRKRNVA